VIPWGKFLALAVRTTLAALGLALATSVHAEEPAWTLLEKTAPLAGAADVQHTRWSIPRTPGTPYDVIGLHRYRTSTAPVAALLYLPGTNMNGVAALSDDDHNLWLFLAHRGVNVFTVDYRTHAVPASGVSEFAFMRGWTMAAFVSDIQAAAAKARAESGQGRLFVAGFSRGVSLGYAFAATEPDGVAGLVALDGFFKNHAPRNQYDAAADLQKLETSGAWASDVAGRAGWESREKLMLATAANPARAASDPKFKTIGEQLANVLYTAWRPGGLANAVDGLSNPQVLAKLLAGYDRYYPAVQDADGRSISDRDDDPRTPIDDLWGEMKTPILYFGCTGMGGDWLLNGIYSADKSGSSDVTLNVLERYGHLDVIVGERARAEVYETTSAWILKRARP
jgi:pimeloyl-ACP methyl ester carboxylesterase